MKHQTTTTARRCLDANGLNVDPAALYAIGDDGAPYREGDTVEHLHGGLYTVDMLHCCLDRNEPNRAAGGYFTPTARPSHGSRSISVDKMKKVTR